ncbi:hypothetical protein LOTGIDRAFT_236638 [Lottia gigantea]|uniref:PIH1 domain-containing protein 2 n=1 Tax=Lottia gigantea TaxID=225164 RepID=V3YYZ0_LOTGI|nr:hypothetical protein LOTGIDRAFT_236638 [Lottia gigantea]ESO83338.1 hypothetical protein LOTGIDRAFT_236638 [Lottia gigantea]
MASVNMDKTAFMNQAQHIWSMLDDMSKNDPAGYKKFIDQQIKQGKEEMAPPKPHMCISTNLKVPEKIKLYINFFGWAKIPGPKSAEDAVPVMGSSIQEEKENGGKYKIVSVAFNPKVLEEFGRDAKNSADLDTLINLAMDYIDQLNKVKCSRSYSILPKDDLYKGDLKKLQKSFSVKSEQKDKEFSDNFDELSKTFGPLAGASKGGLFEQLANIAVDDNTEKTTGVESEQKGPQIFLPDTVKKPGLIQEISEPTQAKIHKEIPKDVTSPVTPKYEVEKSWNDKNQGQCCIRIYLPDVTSVVECELDISEEELELVVPEKYKLKMQLVNKVDDEHSTAKFIKQTHCLVVTMPILKK